MFEKKSQSGQYDIDDEISTRCKECAFSAMEKLVLRKVEPLEITYLFWDPLKKFQVHIVHLISIRFGDM